MNKIIKVFLIIIMLSGLLIFTGNSYKSMATNDIANIKIDSKIITNGSTVAIGIRLENAVDFVSSNFNITYDDTKLEYKSYEIGDSLKKATGDTNGTILLNANISGQIKVGYISDPTQTSETKNAGTILNLTFNVIGDAGMVTNIETVFTNLSKSDGTKVNTSVENGTVSIISGFKISSTKLSMNVKDKVPLKVSTLPNEIDLSNENITWISSDETVAKVDSNGVVEAISTGTATITAQIAEQTISCTVNVYGILGDYDKDGSITAYDAYIALKVSTDVTLGEETTEEQIQILDVNKDGEITANDAYEILKYSVGIIENF